MAAKSALFETPNEPLWTWDTVAQAVQSPLSLNMTPDRPFTSVVLDSRDVVPGSLFIPLIGTKQDGHQYLEAAFKNGAAGALSMRSPQELGQPLAPYAQNILEVSDTYAALIQLAKTARQRAKKTMRIAVTGSAGKTSTKEALYYILSTISGGQAHKSPLSYNNHRGVPMTMVHIPPDTRFVVQEMGMNHAGELSHLSNLFRPQICLITSIGTAHIQAFEGPEGIAHAKAEIFDAIQPPGIAVLNHDTPFFEILKAKAEKKDCRIITFGEHPESTLRLQGFDLNDKGSTFSFLLGGQTLKGSIPYPGRHWVQNILGILGVIKALGLDIHQALQAVKTLPSTGPDGRGRAWPLSLNGGTVTLLDDAYNANPESMRAMFQTLSLFQPQTGGRRIAVLADMGEMGKTAARAHADLAPEIARHHIDGVLTMGPLMTENLAKTLPPELFWGHADNTDQLMTLIIGAVRPGDIIALKGSNAMRLTDVADALKKNYPKNPSGAT